jgi:hypothetical protein
VKELHADGFVFPALQVLAEPDPLPVDIGGRLFQDQRQTATNAVNAFVPRPCLIPLRDPAQHDGKP